MFLCSLKCNLDRHIKSLHSNNPCKLVCEHCGNEYSSQNSLNEHMEVAHKKVFSQYKTLSEKNLKFDLFFIVKIMEVQCMR